MDLAPITPAVVEASLRALRNGEPPDEALLSIEWAEGLSREENILKVTDLLHGLIWQAYADLRMMEGLTASQPTDRQTALETIREDFSIQNGELHACSALYFRYGAPMPFSIEALSQAANVVPQQYRRRLNHGLALMVQKLHRLAIQNRVDSNHPGRYLPLPDYTRLVGVQKYFDTLDTSFTNPDGPFLVSLEGLGGIGKTSLARAYVSLPQTVSRWGKILWVSARQSYLSQEGIVTAIHDPAATLEDISVRLAEQLDLPGLAGKALPERLVGLRASLAAERALIVVDNLETVLDQEQLVPALAKLAGTSRFLITTRQTLRSFAYVHTLSLKELDAECAYELLAAETSRRGRDTVISAKDFGALYQLTGGIPLAIKLVAAQLNLRPLSEIQDGFRSAGKGMDGLYRYLYWQTWQALHDPTRRLLLSFLPANPEGEDIEFLRLMSGQTGQDFFEGLEELDRFSLLEINGDAGQPLYRLHQLTVTFLQTDILNHWSGEKLDDNPAGL